MIAHFCIYPSEYVNFAAKIKYTLATNKSRVILILIKSYFVFNSRTIDILNLTQEESINFSENTIINRLNTKKS